MEKEKGLKSLINQAIITSIFVVGAIAASHGCKINQIKEITSTYQGYTAEDGRGYLVFDDKKIEAREGLPALVIEGNPDTLKIGKEYTIKYSTKNSNNFFPKKIIEIKYAKHSK